jgi:hypothetical protein
LVEDYIGHDDLRRRLGAIIDRATEARKCVQQLTAADAGVTASTRFRRCRPTRCWPARRFWWPTTRNSSARRSMTS